MCLSSAHHMMSLQLKVHLRLDAVYLAGLQVLNFTVSQLSYYIPVTLRTPVLSYPEIRIAQVGRGQISIHSESAATSSTRLGCLSAFVWFKFSFSNRNHNH